MQDSHEHWDREGDDDAGTGLIWRTARNLGILLVGCLLLLGILSWRGGTAERLAAGSPEEPGQSAETADLQSPRQSPRQSPQQVTRSTAMGEEMVIPAGPNGHFLVTAQIDGVEILFLVDTGASQVILTAEDAERLGYRADDLEFSQRFETANGTILGAPLLLPYFQIGDLEIEDVQSSVILAPMSTSLLGMSFLSRLESFEVREEGLILRW